SQFLHGLPPWRRDESLAVILAGNVSQLNGIPTAKGDLAAAVQHLAPWIEVLINNDHGCSKVSRTNGCGQTGAAGSDDDDIGLVVPLNGWCRRNRRKSCPRRRQTRRTDAGSSLLDEITPADAFLGHVCTSEFGLNS